MSRVVRLLLAVTVAMPLVAAMPGRAIACECADRTPKEVIRHADAIVKGTVVGERQVDAGTTASTVDVKGIYRGKVGASIVLVAAVGFAGGSDCAVLYPVGSTVDPLVLDRGRGQVYVTSACALLTEAQVARHLGPARRPPPPIPVQTGVASAPLIPPLGTDWLAVGAGVLLAIGAMALFVRRLARPARARPTPLDRLHEVARAATDDPRDQR